MFSPILSKSWKFNCKFLKHLQETIGIWFSAFSHHKADTPTTQAHVVKKSRENNDIPTLSKYC